jgi:hypothetical protein
MATEYALFAAIPIEAVPLTPSLLQQPTLHLCPAACAMTPLARGGPPASHAHGAGLVLGLEREQAWRASIGGVLALATSLS